MRKNIKLIYTAMLVICVGAMLSGCFGGYSGGVSTSEKNEIVAEGRRLMQDYLDAYIPDGKVISCEIVTEGILGQGTRSYPTEYVRGKYKDADGEWTFAANTETGSLYSSKYFVELEKIIKRKLLEGLGLDEGAEFERFLFNSVWLPHHCEKFGHRDDDFRFFEEEEPRGNTEMVEPSSLSFPKVLPIAMVDPEGYVEREDRQTIYITYCKIVLPEGTDPATIPEYAEPYSADGIIVLSLDIIVGRGFPDAP